MYSDRYVKQFTKLRAELTNKLFGVYNADVFNKEVSNTVRIIAYYVMILYFTGRAKVIAEAIEHKILQFKLVTVQF